MRKTPFLNASLAALYILSLVFAVNSTTWFPTPKDTLFAPVVMLSLFVLSAAVMGFLFVYRPLELYFDNHKQEALIFFGKTVGFFACFLVIFIIGLLYTAYR